MGTRMNRNQILVIEDNPITREGLLAVLQAKGFAVDSVKDGQQALTYLRWNQPAIILLDLNLPVLHGADFLKNLASLPLKPRPKIILVTGEPGIGPEWALANGCFGFIPKPIELEALFATLRQCLDAVLHPSLTGQAPGAN